MQQSPARVAKIQQSTSPDTKKHAQASDQDGTERPIPVPSASSQERKAMLAEGNGGYASALGHPAAVAAGQGN